MADSFSNLKLVVHCYIYLFVLDSIHVSVGLKYHSLSRPIYHHEL